MLVNVRHREVDLPVIAAEDCSQFLFFLVDYTSPFRAQIKIKIGSTSRFADRSNNSGVRESSTPFVYLHVIGWLNGSSSFGPSPVTTCHPSGCC